MFFDFSIVFVEVSFLIDLRKLIYKSRMILSEVIRAEKPDDSVRGGKSRKAG